MSFGVGRIRRYINKVSGKCMDGIGTIQVGLLSKVYKYLRLDACDFTVC